MRCFALLSVLSCFEITTINAFIITTNAPSSSSPPSTIQSITKYRTRSTSSLFFFGANNNNQKEANEEGEEQEQVIQISTQITEERVEQLFAWLSRAFAGDSRYNNLMLAIAAIFATNNTNRNIVLQSMLDEAMSLKPSEDQLCGAPYSQEQRQSQSLSAMGALQWTGQWRTRPHALLRLDGLSDADDWIRTLPRGCKRTLKKALAQNFTVAARPIPNDAPAPHSSLAHFRCVVEHEVRLLSSASGDPEDFFDALAEAVGRYQGTTRMAGEIREYRDAETGRVIAFAHEVRKGRTIRGQWFYATDQGSKSYVWFHSVHSLVARAIEAENVDVVDLGPSGSDAFSELKAKYGFESVVDWPGVADYLGPFWCYETQRDVENGLII